MSDSSEFLVRPMTRAEIDLAVDWAAGEGWNPGLADADCFHAADAGGFLLGRLGADPIGCMSAVRYADTFGFLGFYIMKPEHRGKGLGLRIWDAGMARLQGRVIGLDGVVAQQENYRKSGFVLAHRNIRFGGTPGCRPSGHAAIMPVDAALAPAVTDYDRAFFPADRAAFLRCWLQPDRREAVAFVEGSRVRGYGVVRPCHTGFKIGPLFADTDEIADILFQTLAARAGSDRVFLDCPEPNDAAVALAKRHGLSPVFETARMYRGVAPSLPLARIFGITTFELG
jgi:GNAT superfamily N-acetyltransferase